VIIVVGFIRAMVAAKGWVYYVVNIFFWAKIATFLAVALLSIVPMPLLLRWRTPSVASAATAALFLLLPVFAAAMARGYGELTR
jgi:putative membrane protein